MDGFGSQRCVGEEQAVDIVMRAQLVSSSLLKLSHDECAY
jgi:hypothetical protein